MALKRLVPAVRWRLNLRFPEKKRTSNRRRPLLLFADSGLAVALLYLSACQSALPGSPPNAGLSEAGRTEAPIDWGSDISAAAFTQTPDGEWVSPVVEPAFPFDELIYSWKVRLRRRQAFRLYLRVTFGPDDKTDWLYGGFWGDLAAPVTGRKKPIFDRGQVDMDWLKLKTKARAIQFKVTSAGAAPLDAPPSIHLVSTDNHPAPETAARFRPVYDAPPPTDRVFDVPLRRQIDSHGERMKDRCQSAALASALQYYGKHVNLEDIVHYTHDPEYNYPGLWPRVTAAAQEFGLDAYVDRFRDWTAVRRALAEGKLLLCSIRMAEGDCKAPPYPSMGNHIVVLCGVTDDGRAVITDSALGKSGRGYLCQWLQEDFEKVWMKTKGGVAMVICPPPGAPEHRVANLPPFPETRIYPQGDDH